MQISEGVISSYHTQPHPIITKYSVLYLHVIFHVVRQNLPSFLVLDMPPPFLYDLISPTTSYQRKLEMAGKNSRQPKKITAISVKTDWNSGEPPLKLVHLFRKISVDRRVPFAFQLVEPEILTRSARTQVF